MEPVEPSRTTLRTLPSLARWGKCYAITREEKQELAGLDIMETPDGPFGFIVDGDELIAAGWSGDPQRLLAHVHPSLRPSRLDDSPGYLRTVRLLVADYYAGDHSAPARAEVKQLSGEFRLAAWRALREVPAGQLVSYAELAELAGRPSAVRAAASACSRNAVALFVPCHRVVRSDGSHGGFAYGLDLKERLIGRELSR